MTVCLPVLLTAYLLVFPRTYDPIVIKGHEFRELLKMPVDKLCLYSANDQGSLLPALFQIDGMKDGEYIWDHIFEKGKNAGDDNIFFTQTEAQPAHKSLMTEDEVVFLAESLGGKSIHLPLPQNAYEIEVTDPNGGGKGYAYLTTCDGRTRDGKDAIHYHPENNTVESPEYIYGFTDPLHKGILNLFALNDKGPVTNILDRFKFRLSMRFFFGKVFVSRGESDLNSQVAAYIDGPVRVVLKLKYSVRLIGDIPSPSVTRIVKNYKNMGEYPNDLFIPFSPGVFMTDGELLMAFDFRKNASGARVYTSAWKDEAIIDGRMDDADRKLASSEFPMWMAVYNDEGGFVAQIKADPALLHAKLTTGFFYRDDETFGDEEEYERGSFGEIGWKISGLQNLTGGKYFLKIAVYGKRGFTKGDESEFLRIEDDPLLIHVQEIPSL